MELKREVTRYCLPILHDTGRALFVPGWRCGVIIVIFLVFSILIVFHLTSQSIMVSMITRRSYTMLNNSRDRVHRNPKKIARSLSAFPEALLLLHLDLRGAMRIS